MNYLYRANKYKRVKIKAIIFGLICILSTASLSGCILVPDEDEAIAPPLKRIKEVKYNTETVKKGTIVHREEVQGEFISERQISLCFKNQGGRLKTVNFKVGDHIKKGDIIAELFAEDFEAQIQGKEIELEKLKLDVQTRASAAERQIKNSERLLEAAKKEYQAVLESRESYSKQQLEQVQERVIGLEADYEGLKDTYSNIIKQSELDYKVIKLQLDKMKDEQERVRIKATISGKIVYLEEAKLGDPVTANKTFVTLADSSELKVKYSGDKIGFFKTGMDVKLKVSNEEFDGKVVMTPYSLPDDAAAEMRNSIYIKAEKAPGKAEVGTVVNISITVAKKDNVIVLPKGIIQKYKGSTYVYVLKDGIREERIIKLGLETDTQSEIAEGLKEGEVIIT